MCLSPLAINPIYLPASKSSKGDFFFWVPLWFLLGSFAILSLDMSDQLPKFHLITFGCQMNKNDSERMESLLKSVGFLSSEVAEEADLILINTCSVRQSAEDRVFSKVHAFQELNHGLYAGPRS